MPNLRTYHPKVGRENPCEVCGRKSEVSHPDGLGDQTYYCAEHEPATLLDEIEEDDRGTT